MRLVKVATCNLNQWAMDFEGNLKRIIESIRLAKKAGATFRVGPELEISGYGCEDHFNESDTFMHTWECISELLMTDVTDGILCDIGACVMHRNVPYNCRVFILNRKIVMIRPKMHLANDGNYRETRWFTAWQKGPTLEDHYLPRTIRAITGQEKVPFGIGAVATMDTVVASETCEELFTPNAPHIWLSLGGVEIIANGSGSHHNLRKISTRIDLIRGATAKGGGVYLYANQKGCDGGRLYFDGCAMVMINGELVAQGSQFSLGEVEMVYATVDLEEVRSFRACIASRSVQAAQAEQVPRVDVDFQLGPMHYDPTLSPSLPMQPEIPDPMEEIAYGPACWLWDYLRRSGQRGYFLPLSGGADSSSVAAIVGIMTQLVVEAVKKGDEQTLADVRKVTRRPDYTPADAKDFCSQIFCTTYMASVHSGEETRSRAENLAKQLGSMHREIRIDEMTTAIVNTFYNCTKKKPVMQTGGGSVIEDIALQNIQARSRMVLAYFMAQLVPWSVGSSGTLLVLSSGNVDEGLRGYLTKYDCSSGDINPIGSISKTDLKKFLWWASDKKGYSVLARVVQAAPTAELGGAGRGAEQTDEEDMGMSYDELGVFGRLRKIMRCGPVSMFESLCHTWSHLPPKEVAVKVKRFFFFYSINRHKMTTLTPSYHAEKYSPDDNRHDLRQFLYPSSWTWQFRKMDDLVAQMECAKHAEG